MSRKNLLTVTITVSALEDVEIPIQVDISEPIKYRTLLNLYERLAETCREAIADGKDN